MEICRDFMQRLRRKEFEEVDILLSEYITPKLMEYVKLLTEVKFIEGFCHTYYGDVKKIIASFVVFFSSIVDDLYKVTDKYTNVINKDELLFLMERTITIHRANQDEFVKTFLPLKSPEEKEVLKEIRKEYESYMEKLNELKKEISKFRKEEQIMDFVKEHFKISIIKTSEMLNFTHVYLGMMLADSLPKIRISLEEIYKRMCINLKKIQEDHDAGINELLHRLYDKNQEKNYIVRKTGRAMKRYSLEMAEVCRGIENITTKIENMETEIPLTRIKKEVAYWGNRTQEFYEVADNLTKLKAAQDEVIKEQKMYSSFQIKELIERRDHLTQIIIEANKTLISFFAVRGTDRILYTDKVGPYYCDEFNHQVYVFDHGLGIYHINCEGDFKEFPEEPYHFDKFGRFINKDGEKIYQCAGCTSQHKLTEDNLMMKITKDCGHSEKVNKTCRMLVKDHTKAELLPDFDPIDIRQTLDSETVRYLWDSFGSLLPEALYDVGIARPRNPIHFLAHKLIYHKYRRTTAELQQKKKEAEQYQDDVFKKRKDKEMAATKKWKSKQVKRRKPEESDDSETRAIYDAKIAEQMFINSLNYFYL